MNLAYQNIIASSDSDRRDLFITAATRVGTTVQNIEKDFWVCWTLDTLFHRLQAGGPRLLFKGGTSLSKAYGLISRFSEDIDVTVFRSDIGQEANVEQLEALSKKKRNQRLEAIKSACQTYINGKLHAELAALAKETDGGRGKKSCNAAHRSGRSRPGQAEPIDPLPERCRKIRVRSPPGLDRIRCEIRRRSKRR